MDRYEARKAIVEDLKAEGALVEIEDYSHNVGTCYRCHTTVEPRVSLQWFVKMEDLAKPAIEAVKSKETKFVPVCVSLNMKLYLSASNSLTVSTNAFTANE